MYRSPASRTALALLFAAGLATGAAAETPASSALASQAAAPACDGDLTDFLAGVKADAIAAGATAEAADLDRCRTNA